MSWRTPTKNGDSPRCFLSRFESQFWSFLSHNNVGIFSKDFQFRASQVKILSKCLGHQGMPFPRQNSVACDFPDMSHGCYRRHVVLMYIYIYAHTIIQHNYFFKYTFVCGLQPPFDSLKDMNHRASQAMVLNATHDSSGVNRCHIHHWLRIIHGVLGGSSHLVPG